jgi:SAM-dependent methyltransferase
MYRNHSVYSTRSAVEVYARMPDIPPAERLIFARELPRIESGPVLDIGVGAGRTTAVLAPLCRNYVGIDYSQAMISHCRKRFAQGSALRLIHADAASLPMFESETFRFILFSFNGIDSVDHDHRLRILREIRRLLAKDGRFAFSAHNRNYAGIERRPRFHRPLRLRGVARTGVEIVNHLRMRRAVQACDAYELINDPPHLFSVITYYIDRRSQVAQLEQCGLRTLDVIDPDGQPVRERDDETLSPNFYYVTEPSS